MKFACSLLISFMIMKCVTSQTPAEHLSIKFAERMRQTLSLTSGQYTRLFEVNQLLQNEKSVARNKNIEPVNATRSIQAIENKRDRLYRAILTEEQFQLYLERKKDIISNN